MKKKTTKDSTKRSINCSSKVTPIKATLESEITPEIEIKKPPKWNARRLLPVGSIITKHFKGKVLEILVTEDGLKYEGRTYRSISGLAMDITGYPVSGYVFFEKELKNGIK